MNNFKKHFLDIYGGCGKIGFSLHTSCCYHKAKLMGTVTGTSCRYGILILRLEEGFCCVVSLSLFVCLFVCFGGRCGGLGLYQLAATVQINVKQ